MSREINNETRLIDLTVGELLGLISGGKTEPGDTEREFVYGYAGVCGLFGVSRPTAGNLIHGKLKEAVYQQGRTIIVDKNKALELFNK